MIKILALVAAGGAAGAVGRYLVVVGAGALFGPGFPWGVLTVNVVGSFAMGILTGLGNHVWTLAPEIRSLLVIGVLGGFTTFSAFSQDAVDQFERGDHAAAAIYMAASVGCSVLALVAGLRLMRLALA